MGWLWNLGREERRAKVAQVIARTDGNLVKTAHQLGIHRSHLYRLIWRDELWPVVNAARERYLRDQDHERALARTGKVWEVKPRRRWFHGRKKA